MVSQVLEGRENEFEKTDLVPFPRARRPSHNLQNVRLLKMKLITHFAVLNIAGCF